MFVNQIKIVINMKRECKYKRLNYDSKLVLGFKTSAHFAVSSLSVIMIHERYPVTRYLLSL